MNITLEQLEQYNDNAYLYGILFMIYIIAGKHIVERPASNIKRYIENPLVKYIVVFAAAFIGTKNIRQSLYLTIGYGIVFDLILEPTSPLSIVSMTDETKLETKIDSPIMTRISEKTVEEPMPY